MTRSGSAAALFVAPGADGRESDRYSDDAFQLPSNRFTEE